MRIRSLRVRLILMFMLVVMIALGAYAVFASQITRDRFQHYLDNEQTNDQGLISQIQAMYHQPQDAQRLQALIEQSATQNKVRTLVINPNQLIVADSARKLVGQTLTIPLFLTLESTNAGTSPLPGAPFPPGRAVRIMSTDGRIVASGPPAPLTNTNFIDSVNRALERAVLVAGCVAGVLAIMLSGTILKPVRALTRAARQLEQGNLTQRVQVRRQDEIGDLAHAFDTMADSLEREEHLRRQLLSNVAHELRTPLTTIRAYLEALQDQVITPDSAVIASIYEEAMLLSRLVTDLQDLALAEAGQLRLQRVPIALEDVITKAINALSLQAENKKISISANIASDLPLVEADAQRIGQILRNLLSNAIKYTPERGEVRVSAQAMQKEVQVSVRDNGVGIAAKHLPSIFKHFYRADTSRTRETGGSGLGLAIVEQLVQAHGGRITVESSVGQGTCFIFTLPMVLQQKYIYRGAASHRAATDMRLE
ncbi:MAG TPA: ATP-binding protein [Ktedonobacteraceae bacterium]|nr:ATP-binding protein [Ktedonobacteraceae bacterium]